jgi:hypothetical protein
MSMKRLSIYIKKVCVALCLMAVTANQAQAQRRLPGIRALQVTAGTVNGFNMKFSSHDFAYHAGIAFTTYTRSGNHWQVGGEYLEKRHPYKDTYLPQAQFTVDGGYYLSFLSDGTQTVNFSAGLSAVAGYESVNWNKKTLFDGAALRSKDAFLYGGAFSIEIETYLCDRLALLLNVRERLLMGSSIGKFNTQIGIGLKFIIN